MRVTVQPETKRKHISESDRYCPNELVSFVPRANILKTDSFLTATIWTNDRNQPRCINVVCCVAYLLLTAHTGNPSVCVHVSVCLSRTLHTASCPRVTHKPFRPTLFPSSAPLHASYTFTSPAHVHTHTRKLSSWFTPTLRRRQGLISSPLDSNSPTFTPPFLVHLESYLFCCLRATAAFWEVVVESPLAWREGTDTHIVTKKLRERSVMCQSHFCIVRTAISHFKKYMSQHVESCCTEWITTKGKETYTEPD